MSLRVPDAEADARYEEELRKLAAQLAQGVDVVISIRPPGCTDPEASRAMWVKSVASMDIRSLQFIVEAMEDAYWAALTALALKTL